MPTRRYNSHYCRNWSHTWLRREHCRAPSRRRGWKKAWLAGWLRPAGRVSVTEGSSCHLPSRRTNWLVTVVTPLPPDAVDPVGPGKGVLRACVLRLVSGIIEICHELCVILLRVWERTRQEYGEELVRLASGEIAVTPDPWPRSRRAEAQQHRCRPQTICCRRTRMRHCAALT